MMMFDQNNRASRIHTRTSARRASSLLSNLYLISLALRCNSFSNPRLRRQQQHSWISSRSHDTCPTNTFLHGTLAAKEATTTPEDAVGLPTRHPSIKASRTSTLEKLPYEKQIVKLGRLGQTDAALQLFRSLERPTLRQINAVLDACGRANPPRLQTCYDIFRSCCPKPNVYTFGALLAACARAGDADQAINTLRTMQQTHGVTANAVVYHSAISACARASPPRVQTALDLLRQARDERVTLTVVGYNAAVAAAARSADPTTALELLEEMEGSTGNDVPSSDAVTYGTVLSACERSEQWNLVLQVARRMQDRGFVLDGIAYTSVLHACQQLGLASEAVGYLEQMKNSTQFYQSSTAGRQVAGTMPPLLGADAVAYRLTISACARGRAWKEGIQVLDDYCSQGGASDVVAYTAAINGCEYAGEWKEAFRLLERMRQSGAQPNEVTFAAVIGACATASGHLVNGRIPDATDPSSYPLPQRKALQLLQALKTDESVPSPNIQVYNAAIRACAESMDLKSAWKLLQDLRQEGLVPTIVTYGCLMTACERVGSTAFASKVFKSLREDGLEPNEIIYGAAISCCRKAKEADRALLLLKKMLRENLVPNIAVFNTVLTALAETTPSPQSIENCLATYRLLRQNPSASPNRQTYTILVRLLAAQMEPRQAEKLLNDMTASGLVPDVDLYTATISSYERIGQPLKALNLMESMREGGYDFYESAVLNSAFKRAVKLVNAVGRGLTPE